MELEHRVFAYITHGNRLLVFDHGEHPDAGTQVPAGTRVEQEPPEDAVVREAEEETGLTHLRLERFLGEVDHPVPDEGQMHRRRFYHLVCTRQPPEQWTHYECCPSDGTTEPILFDLYWVKLPDEVTPLAAGHDAMLEELLHHIGRDRKRECS